MSPEATIRPIRPRSAPRVAVPVYDPVTGADFTRPQRGMLQVTRTRQGA